jgi:hypothetical protein
MRRSALVGALAFLGGLLAATLSLSGCKATGGASDSGPGGDGAAGPSGGFDPGASPLTVVPADVVVSVALPGPTVTQPFQCVDGQTGLAVAAKWSLGLPAIGTLSPEGLFVASAKAGGATEIRCAHQGLEAATSLTVELGAVDQGGLTPEEIASFAGGAAKIDPDWMFLYPYDRTVFPRGIPAPEIQLGDGAAPGELFHVRIVAPYYGYDGYFDALGMKGTVLPMSQAAWDALAATAGGASATVAVEKIHAGKKYGPVEQTWKIAQGSLHGTIYYNTYDSLLAGKDGAMMRITGGLSTPEVLVGGCTVCHSVSSDGSTAAAANHDGPGGTFALGGGTPKALWKDPERPAFAGLYPTGELLVVQGAPGPDWPPNTPGTEGSWTSELRSTAGEIIPKSGIESHYAQTPAFSHDGKLLAFVDRMPQWPFTSVLALLDFDVATRKFSNYRVLATPSSTVEPLVGQLSHHAWPSFTPDNRWVVFQYGTGADLGTWNGNTGRLQAVEVATGVVVDLAELNGDAYVPRGDRDREKSYEPSVAPIASGGYFWVIFTSRRTYGNRLPGTAGPFGEAAAETKRLWVAALEIDAATGTDPSHPPFYLAGQEPASRNGRGFWALDPCEPTGAPCSFGDECCEGGCNQVGDPPEWVCGPPDDCAEEFEICTSDGDCCKSNLACVGGHCSIIAPK